MAELNVIYCLEDLKNTGFDPSCFLVPGFFKGAFQVPPGKTYTAAELVDFRPTLIAGTLNDSKGLRVFPLHGFRTVTDSSEEKVIQTLGDGTPTIVREGRYNISYQYTDGALCLHFALLTRNFKGSSWIFYDDQFQFYGWRKLDATGLAYGLAGIPVVFHAEKWKHNTGAEAATFMVYFSYEAVYMNQSLGFLKVDFNPAEITGLQTVALTGVGAAPLAGVSNIKATFGCANTNMYDLYSADLADITLWKAYNKATGNEITISTVVVNAALKAFTVSLLTTDPDYTAAGAAGDIEIRWVGPTELDAADIPGFESNTVTIKRG
jgi:hypothetical protein